MPVDLRKLASCETTTCSSLVRWQSNSSMSVPRSTALREPTNRRHVVRYHCSTKGQWGHDKGRQQWWNKMRHIHVTENHRAVKRWISCTLSAEVGCGHKLITTELRWHTLTTITCTGTSYVSHRRSAVKETFFTLTKGSTHCLKAAMVFSRFSPAPAKTKSKQYEQHAVFSLHLCYRGNIALAAGKGPDATSLMFVFM